MLSEPRIELIPVRYAVCSDEPVVLDVLIRITPPQPEIHFPRVPLNLALVLDRSGSMSEGKKMRFAGEAAAFAVAQLLRSDRVSVTIFDNEVETIISGGPPLDKPALIRQIKQIAPRGSTDLHGGWAEGGRQAEAGLFPGGVNRVILLSDGLANAGVVDSNTIAAEARGLAARGVSTTTIGVGDDYNEDLMEAMARAGDGHYYYIESPVQLVDMFQTELQGLMETLGQKASLGLEPMPDVTVGEVLNDFDRTPAGRLMLPNLVMDMPLLVVARLKLPSMPGNMHLLDIRLAWDSPKGGERRVLRATLDDLPAVPMAQWLTLPEALEVREQVALLMAARAQKEAAGAAERGDIRGSGAWLATAREVLGTVPQSVTTSAELAALTELESALDTGQHEHFIKGSKFRAYSRARSRSPKPNEPPAKKGPS